MNAAVHNSMIGMAGHWQTHEKVGGVIQNVSVVASPAFLFDDIGSMLWALILKIQMK